MSLIRKITALSLALSLACMSVPAAAIAAIAPAEGYVASTGNLCVVDEATGWGFYFTTSTDGTAEITTSNEATGATSITLPDTVEVDGVSYTVTSIAEASKVSAALFATVRSTLTGVTFPSALQTIGAFTCYNCTLLTEVVFPASLWGISKNAFRACTSLESVTFEGTYSGYIGNYAFYGCTSLKEIWIPALLGLYSESSSAIGEYCFQGCTSLTAIYWGAGRADTNEQRSAMCCYFKSNNCTLECSSLTTFVYYIGVPTYYYHGGSGTPSASTNYYTIDFYSSEEAYEAATSRSVTSPSGELYYFYDSSQALANVTYKKSTKLTSILTGDTTNAFAGSTVAGVKASDAVPSAAEAYGSADGVWCIGDSMMSSHSSTLSDTTYAFPVSKYDFSYAWIEASSKYYLADDGSVDLSSITVYAADGSALTDADYTLHIYQLQYDEENESYYSYDKEGHEGVELSAEQCTQVGSYTVVAESKGAGFEGSTTAAVTFAVSEDDYEPTVATYEQDSTADTAALANRDLSLSTSETVLFNVLVDASDEAALLVASALAGLGGGIVALAEDGEVSLSTRYALNATNANQLIVLETTMGTISDSLIQELRTSINSLGNADISILPFDALEEVYASGASVSSAQLALDVYNTIHEFGPLEDDPYDYSDVAIVASSTNTYGTAVAAQLAYVSQAAVFLTEDDSTISTDTLAALAAGGFSQVYVVGPKGYVSSLVEAAVSRYASGATVTRILANSSAYENSLEMIELLSASYECSISELVLVDSGNTALVALASVVAARMGGACLAAANLVSGGIAESYILGLGLRAFNTVTYMNATSADVSAVSDALLLVAELTSGTGITDSSAQSGGEEAGGESSGGDSAGSGSSGSGQGSSSADKKTAQTIKASPAKKAYKAKKLKKKAATFTVKVKGAATSLKAKSSSKKVTAKVSGSKVKITVKKGCKKGKYQVKVYAKAAGKYAKSNTKTITITVK